MTQYYIDANSGVASDRNLGTISQPWKTINQANITLIAGDIVNVRSGTYTGRIQPVNSGSPGNPITYISEPEYTAVISTSSNGIDLTNKDYITIDGFDFNHCENRWIKRLWDCCEKFRYWIRVNTKLNMF